MSDIDALVHEVVTAWGGSEDIRARMLETLADAWDEGFDACHNGLGGNPYRSES